MVDIQTHLKNFPENSLNEAINFVLYGRPVIKKFTQKRKTLHSTIFYLQEDEMSYLQWISRKKIYTESRIDLKAVTNISDQPTQNALKKFQSQYLLCLTIGEKHFLGMEFPNSQIRDLWWQGIQHFWVLSKTQNITYILHIF